MAVPPEVQQNIEGFMNVMMANVTACDYNKHLLYLKAKGRSGNLRLGKKTLQDGKDVVPIIERGPETDDSDDCVFQIVILRRDAAGSYEVPPLYHDGPIPDKHDHATKEKLWNAVKTALDIFEKIPGNLCTTCNTNLAWCETTTCPACSFATVDGPPNRPLKDWRARVMPQRYRDF